MYNEKRRFQRIPFTAKADLRGADFHTIAELQDICMKGALVKLNDEFNGCVGQKLTLTVLLDGSSDHSITMKTEVTHIRGKVIGLKSLGIDLDSATNLRKLVELNLGDEHLLERELNALMD